MAFIALAAMGAVVGAAQPLPAGRSVHFEYKASLKDIPNGAKLVEFWLPVPHSDDYQELANLDIESLYPYEMAVGANGNIMLHAQLDDPRAKSLTITIRADVVRRAHIQTRMSGGPPLDHEEDSGQLEAYLQPDRLVPLNDQIRKRAREVAGKANAHTDLEIARAIYNHVVSTMKYDKTGKGWGRGDIYYAEQERRGDCTDFNAIFIGYARALGIPARFAIGFPLPPDRSQGIIASYNCWAEFYAKGIGWVPVDPSEAARDPAKREYFFGAHDENRVELSKGRDIVLMPPQEGEPLNYFVYPYAEIDGKAFAGTTCVVTYRDAVMK